jgi:hypothetical protein
MIESASSNLVHRLMQLTVDPELRAICQEIVAREQPLDEWRETESDDEFQTDHYEGGFDADEDAFCFSRFAADGGGEFWFQFTLAEAAEIAAGRLGTLDARPAGQ